MGVEGADGMDGRGGRCGWHIGILCTFMLKGHKSALEKGDIGNIGDRQTSRQLNLPGKKHSSLARFRAFEMPPPFVRWKRLPVACSR